MNTLGDDDFVTFSTATTAISDGSLLVRTGSVHPGRFDIEISLAQTAIALGSNQIAVYIGDTVRGFLQVPPAGIQSWITLRMFIPPSATVRLVAAHSISPTDPGTPGQLVGQIRLRSLPCDE